MKKLGLLNLVMIVLLLVACVQKQDSNQTSKVAKFEVVAEKELDEKEETVTYQYPQQVNDVTQTIKETITYKGDDFIILKLDLSQPFKDDIKQMIASQGFETIKPQLIASIESEAYVQKLKSVSGLSVTIDVPNESEMLVSLLLDMKTVDLVALSNIEGIGFDFTTLEDMKPQQYLNHLEEQGATLVAK